MTKKKINTHRKGKTAELEFFNLLEKNGFSPWKPNKSKYGSKDIFNKFDIITLAVKSEYGPIGVIFKTVPLLIQIKTNRNDYYKAKKGIRQWIKEKNIDIENTYLQVILRVKKGLWRVFDFSKNEEYYINDKFEEVDEK